jgi:hypothetical protein
MWAIPATTTANSASNLAAVNSPWILMAHRTLAQFTAVNKPEMTSQKINVSFGMGKKKSINQALQGRTVGNRF